MSAVRRIDFGEPMVLDEAAVLGRLRTMRIALREIQNKVKSTSKFESLYRTAYTLVLCKHGERLYHTLRDVLKEHAVKRLRGRVLASLYGDFLGTLCGVWRDHQTCLSMARDVLMYLDRVHVENAGVKSVYDLGLEVFRDHVVWHGAIRRHLNHTMLDLIARERNGEMVDRMALRKACHMLLTLGVNSRAVYEEDFETPFLTRTADFYRLESQTLLAQVDASTYLQKVEKRLAEEVERAKRCFDAHTESLVLHVVEEELISKHVKTVLEMEDSGIEHMLKASRMDDLHRMYQLYRRVSEGAQAIALCVSSFLRARGRVLVTEEHGRKTNPITFVQNLIDLKDHFDELVNLSFASDSVFQQKIDADFEYLLNLNPRSAEYLSLFIDAKLKKRPRRWEQVADRVLDKTLEFFRFLQEKDVFERYYKLHLTRRLLTSGSEEIEKNMALKLKPVCGYGLGSKLEGMFKDLQASKALTEEFKGHSYSSKLDFHNIDFNMRVLTSGLWPSHASPLKCNLPVRPRSLFEAFRRFYLAKHGGRQLVLQPHLGHADLKAVFFPLRRDDAELEGGKSSMMHGFKSTQHILQVSTLQMCVLLVFNVLERASYEDICKDTALPERELKRTLQSLAADSQPILCKHPRSMGIEAYHYFTVNESFSARQSRVRVRQSSDSEPEPRVEDVRKFEVEGAIVRALKTRKRMQHNQLVAEVTEQLSARFSPSPVVIKRRIEGLIERDYIARTSEDRKTYTYLG